MLKKVCTPSIKSQNLCRKAALGLLAAGTMYVAPAVLPINTAMAVTQPSALLVEQESTESMVRPGRQTPASRHRGSRGSRWSRESRPSRWSRGSRGHRYSRGSRGRHRDGNFGEGRRGIRHGSPFSRGSRW